MRLTRAVMITVAMLYFPNVYAQERSATVRYTPDQGVTEFVLLSAVDGGQRPIETLRDLLLNTDSQELQKATKKALFALTVDPSETGRLPEGCGEHKRLDPRQTFRVLFLNQPDQTVPDKVFAYIYRQKRFPSGNIKDLLGNTTICEVFLTYKPEKPVAIQSTYVATRVNNPLLTQLPQVLQKIGVEAGLGMVIAAQPTVEKEASKPKPLYAWVASVTLPFARGKIDVSDFVVEAKPDNKLHQGTSSYTNTPLTHFEFGLQAASILNTSGARQRAKIDAGKVAVDSLAGAIQSFAILNYHPAAYDSQGYKVTFAERFRIFGGMAVAPQFGGCIGLGISPIRGLSLNAGVAELLVKVPPRGQAFGDTISDPHQPLPLGWGRVYFVGLAYNLGGGS